MNLEVDIEALKNEISRIKESLASMRELPAAARSRGAEVIDKVQQSTARLQKEFANNANGVLSDFKKKPVVSVLATFAVGMILGSLFGRPR